MSINFSIYNSTSLYENNLKNTKTKSNSSNDTNEITQTTNSEETEETANSSSTVTNSKDLVDTYKTTKNTISKEEVDQILAQQEDLKAKNLETLINSIFSKQAKKSVTSSILENSTSLSKTGTLAEAVSQYAATLSEDEILKAKEAVSEDGYYGVEQTSERILNLAKAIAGDDPEKLEEMRKAVEKAFNNVEKMWGGELPSICQETYKKVMQTFDQWQEIA